MQITRSDHSNNGKKSEIINKIIDQTKSSESDCLPDTKKKISYAVNYSDQQLIKSTTGKTIVRDN